MKNSFSDQALIESADSDPSIPTRVVNPAYEDEVDRKNDQATNDIITANVSPIDDTYSAPNANPNLRTNTDVPIVKSNYFDLERARNEGDHVNPEPNYFQLEDNKSEIGASEVPNYSELESRKSQNVEEPNYFELEPRNDNNGTLYESIS